MLFPRCGICMTFAMLIGCVVGVTKPVQSQVVYSSQTIATIYFSQSDWQAALQGPFATETFQGPILNPGLSIRSDAGQIVSGSFLDTVIPGLQTTTFSFTPDIYALGGNFDLSPGGPGRGIQMNLNLDDGSRIALSAQVPDGYTGQFWGFIAVVPLRSVLFTAGTQSGTQEQYALTNLEYAFQASSVPEPGSIGLLSGIGVITGVCHRKRRFVR